jgi:hypothetical protein
MTPYEYSRFLEWARSAGGSGGLLEGFRDTFYNDADVNNYLGLKVSSSSGGGK